MVCWEYDLFRYKYFKLLLYSREMNVFSYENGNYIF